MEELSVKILFEPSALDLEWRIGDLWSGDILYLLQSLPPLSVNLQASSKSVCRLLKVKLTFCRDALEAHQAARCSLGLNPTVTEFFPDTKVIEACLLICL